MAPKKQVPLRPMPMRVTPRQFERLQEARARDGYSSQEHIRRAIDQYLDGLERREKRTSPGANDEPASADVAAPQPVSVPVPASKRQQKLAYR